MATALTEAPLLDQLTDEKVAQKRFAEYFTIGDDSGRYWR